MMAESKVSAQPSEPRWVSVNQCVDQMLGYLAPEQLVSVTWLSHAPADLQIQPRLAMIPANHAHIEEILNWHPDGVIAGQYGAPGLKTLLPRFNIPLREVPLPEDFPQLYANWRLLAGWTHREPAAEALIDTLEAGFQTLARDLTPLQIRTLIINPNGWVAGAGNFQDAYLQKLGLINLAREQGISGWGEVDLEALVRWSPDLIIVPGSHYDGQARATLWMEHPILSRVSLRFPLLELDAEQLSCGTPELLRAGQQIHTHVLENAGKLSLLTSRSLN